ncbi:MAG: adenosine kinase [Bauldia sp.]
MQKARFDAVAIGNAIVDVIARADDDFLAAENLAKGSMHLIGTARAEALYAAMGPAIEASGGSAGNTAAGLGSFGGKAAFIGKVADDHLGEVYRHDMRAMGVHFETPALVGGEPTARSLIVITPDGERTMNTYLGAGVALTDDDIDEELIRSSEYTYLEGYLWDPPAAKAAFRKAATLAHAAGRKVAFTLSDSFCVDRYRQEFLELIRTRAVDLLFANASELRALYETASLDTAVAALQADCRLAAVTVGADGAYVVSPTSIEIVAARPVPAVVDLTGAGDLFASGFLFGQARGMSTRRSAELGTLAAAEVIGHLGARPAVSLQELARQAGYAI